MNTDRDFHAKATRMRSARAFRSLGGGGGSRGSKKPSFSPSKGVVLKGSWSEHRGRRAKADAAGKMKAHIRYTAGDRHKEADRERRQLYDDRGREQTSEAAIERHGEPFVEHRIVLSPSIKSGKVTESDLHVLSQATIQEIRSKNPKAEVTASYAIHTDNGKPHAHLLLTSDQVVRLTRDDYSDLREMNADLRQELDNFRSKGLEHSHQLNFENDQTNDLEIGRDPGQELTL